MILAHKIALDPNAVQETYFRKAAGVARFAYNWTLDQWQQQYDAWQGDPTLLKPSEAALRRQLNALKRDAFPWMLEVTKNAPQMAVIHLGQAFKNFFAGTAEYPAFKKKGRHDSFTLANDQFAIKVGRCISRSSGGCACTKRCGLSGKSWKAPCHAPQIAGF